MKATRAQHPDITSYTVDALKTVRDSVEGSIAIKSKGAEYLEPPSSINSTEQQRRYKRYIAGAEYDGIPDLTRRAWLGKMRISTSSVSLPKKLDYLIQDANGDGAGLASVMEAAASEVFQTKWHVAVVDYKGLTGVDTSALSLADARELNPRAYLKQYSRESLKNWAFGRVGGVLQLTYMELYEQAREFDANTGERQEVDVYLILALDENGDYYQQKVVGGELGVRSYVKINGKSLKFIPVEIISDEEIVTGFLPRQVGALYPICEMELHKYRVSADYKESLAQLVATLMVKGWKMGDMELFKEVNGGREELQLGGLAANNLPDGVDYDVLNSSPALEGFVQYNENASDKMRQLGGSVKTRSEVQRTAKEADIDAAELNAMLSTVASNIENAFRRLVLYCGMFDGLYSQDAIEENLEYVNIELPREFAKPKISDEEVDRIHKLWIDGLYTTRHVLQLLTEGGRGTGEDIDTWEARLGEQNPTVSSMAGNITDEAPGTANNE